MHCGYILSVKRLGGDVDIKGRIVLRHLCPHKGNGSLLSGSEFNAVAIRVIRLGIKRAPCACTVDRVAVKVQHNAVCAP